MRGRAKANEWGVIHEFVSFFGLNKNGKAIYPPYNSPPFNSLDCFIHGNDATTVWHSSSTIPCV